MDGGRDGGERCEPQPAAQHACAASTGPPCVARLLTAAHAHRHTGSYQDESKATSEAERKEMVEKNAIKRKRNENGGAPHHRTQHPPTAMRHRRHRHTRRISPRSTRAPPPA
jgi:hypothetical protein